MKSSWNSTLFRLATDRVCLVVTHASAAISAAIVLLIMLFLLIESVPALRRIGISRFFTDEGWHPLAEQYSLIPMTAATIITTVGAVALATPLGIASAVFSQFYSPRLISICYQRLIALLAGIPSVVFGLWGLTSLVPLLASLTGVGQSLLAATLVLSLMILPTIALVSQAALQAVPFSLLAAGAALGLDRFAIVRRVALPAAKRGIGAGILLALSRALGETMAVLMVSGNVAQLPDSVVSPVRTLTANIALEMGYAGSDHRSVLFVSGVVLMALVAVILFVAKALGIRNDAT